MPSRSLDSPIYLNSDQIQAIVSKFDHVNHLVLVPGLVEFDTQNQRVAEHAVFVFCMDRLELAEVKSFLSELNVITSEIYKFDQVYYLLLMSITLLNVRTMLESRTNVYDLPYTDTPLQ